MQVLKRSDWKQQKRWRLRFPHYKSMGVFCCHGNQFWSNLPQNLKQPFPHPTNATHKIWSRSANWPQIYSSSIGWTTTTDGGPLVYYKFTLWAFGSAQLKIYQRELIIMAIIIITLCQEDNIFGTRASLSHGPKYNIYDVKIWIIYSMYRAGEVSVHQAYYLSYFFCGSGINSFPSGRENHYSLFSYSQVCRGKGTNYYLSGENSAM